jgi:Tfp pilus assembly protein PilO
MNKKNLLDKLLNRKAKDYSFAIIFFIIFSFFVLVVIRPNITTVLNIQKELTELQKLDTDYEQAIFNIIAIQSKLEKNREFFPLLNSALPSDPQVNKIVDDIRKVASDSGIEITKIEINQVNLKEKKSNTKPNSLFVAMEFDNDFVRTNKFIQELLVQRRLKTIRSLNISRNLSEGTESAGLIIKLEVEGYYL